MKYAKIYAVACLAFGYLTLDASAQITETGTQGSPTTVIENLLNCAGGRVSGVGTITASDGTEWTVPAQTNYQTGPFATDLYNSCSGVEISGTAQLDLDSVPIVEVDPDGEVITGYIFADNYFELYVNDTLIGIDAVPFTQFNSSVVRFRVSEPYSLAALLVDWEENLGLGSEANRGTSYFPGDAGFVASFRDENDEVVAITDSNWKAQTYYIAPVDDLDCVAEVNGERLSETCSTAGVNDGTDFYGVHYPQPEGWTGVGFDDSAWPNAHVYTNDTVGINNKPAFTNFPDLFDDAPNDAQFIWTSNLVLDNLVLARTTVGELTNELLGDFNGDGLLNAADIDQLCSGVAVNDSTFDLTGDGIVDSGDLSIWVETIAETTFGDANLDGSVGFDDFLALSDSFGESGGWAAGDFDCSGNVEFADFLLLADNFGADTAAQAVPEPSAPWTMFALVCLTFCATRKSRR